MTYLFIMDSFINLEIRNNQVDIPKMNRLTLQHLNYRMSSALKNIKLLKYEKYSEITLIISCIYQPHSRAGPRINNSKQAQNRFCDFVCFVLLYEFVWLLSGTIVFNIPFGLYIYKMRIWSWVCTELEAVWMDLNEGMIKLYYIKNKNMKMLWKNGSL